MHSSFCLYSEASQPTAAAFTGRGALGHRVSCQRIGSQIQEQLPRFCGSAELLGFSSADRSRGAVHTALTEQQC